MASRWPPAARLQLVGALEKRRGPDSEAFFAAHDLGAAYLKPGDGSSKLAKINAALAAADRRGDADVVLEALQEYLGLALVPPTAAKAKEVEQDDVLPRPQSPEHRKLLQTIWDFLYQRTRWPSYAELDRRFDQQHQLDAVEVSRSMPPGLMLPPSLNLPSDEQQLKLTIAGTAACEGSSEEVDAFLQAVRIAAEIEGSHESAAEQVISGDVLRARAELPAAGRDDLIGRVSQLLYAEQWGWTQASAVGQPDWKFTIGRGVRRFRNVRTLAEYWTAAHPPAESPEPMTETIVAPVVPNKIFLVHGHDEARHEVARFLERGVADVEVVELAEQASQGLTIIEKFEREGETASLAVVLLTPDDVGKSLRDGQERPRARQNVVFELGYFFGRLGRSRVIVLNKGNVEQPSDVSGIVWIAFPGGEWKLQLTRELRAAGLTVDPTR